MGWSQGNQHFSKAAQTDLGGAGRAGPGLASLPRQRPAEAGTVEPPEPNLTLVD